MTIIAIVITIAIAITILIAFFGAVAAEDYSSRTWDGWVYCPPRPAARPETELDSFHFLVEEMEALGVEVTCLLSINMATEVAVILDAPELYEAPVVETPTIALPAYPILVLDDKYVAKCEERDGRAFDTVVEWVEGPTAVVIEYDPCEVEDILALSRELLSEPFEAAFDAGSDESTFFFERGDEDLDLWDPDSLGYSDTLVE